MKSIDSESPAFAELAAALLGEGHSIRFTVRGHSMRPLILDGDVITFQAVDGRGVRTGDVILYLAGPGKLVVHRALQGASPGADGMIRARGDAQIVADVIRPEQILARAICLQRGDRRMFPARLRSRWSAIIYLRLAAIMNVRPCVTEKLW